MKCSSETIHLIMAANYVNETVASGANQSTAMCADLNCIPDTMLKSVEVVTVVLAIGGFLGNGLTVMAIVISGLRKNINCVLIGHLSFADVLYTCLVLPLQAAAYHHRSWVLPEWVCVVQASIRIWLIGVNMSLLSAIALYRFLNIVYPHIYNRITSSGFLYSIIAVCWLFSAIFSSTPIMGVWGSFSFEGKVLQCTFTSGEGVSKSHKVIVVTLGYVIPCVFICFCYARIGCVVYRTRQRAMCGSIHGKQRIQRYSLRLTAMMLFIFLGFFVCTTPFFAINVADPNQNLPVAHIWAPCAAWLLYCLNPVIYTLMDNNFLLAYKQLVCCLYCRSKSSLEFKEQLSFR